MQTKFYRSQTDMLPTFSPLLAVSMAGVGTIVRHNGKNETLPPASRYTHTYYIPSEHIGDHDQQMESLRQFAENLLKQTEENPQAVVEVLNRHFWELV